MEFEIISSIYHVLNVGRSRITDGELRELYFHSKFTKKSMVPLL